MEVCETACTVLLDYAADAAHHTIRPLLQYSSETGVLEATRESRRHVPDTLLQDTFRGFKTMGEQMDGQGIAALNHTLSVSPCCRDVDNRQRRVSNASFCDMAQGTGRAAFPT
ncbi:hypothetical protein IG631_23958 [Alternaria alternata]|nr:hypothetical protein IG631_23958 [Alternaria alternata]